MSDENSLSPVSATSTSRRTSSAASPKLVDLLGRSPTHINVGGRTGPLMNAAANASAQHRRRASLTGLGLSGSPTSTSPFASIRPRNSNTSSSISPTGSIEESAVEDETTCGASASPTSSFARRMSFGARALHDLKTGNGDAFDWSEQIRSRAERSASMTQRNPPKSPIQATEHHKATSIAAPEASVKEVVKPSGKPDHFQERILKGDFYMD